MPHCCRHLLFADWSLAKVLGAAWKEEKPEVRDRYHRLADEVKDELMRAHPEQRYGPRRPGERRRWNRRDPAQDVHHEVMSQIVNMAAQNAT